MKFMLPRMPSQYLIYYKGKKTKGRWRPFAMLVDFGGSVIPVFLIFPFFFETFMHLFRRGWRRHDGWLSRCPICGNGDALFGAGLQAIDNPQDFVDVSSEIEGVINQRPDNTLIINEEDCPNGSGC